MITILNDNNNNIKNNNDNTCTCSNNNNKYFTANTDSISTLKIVKAIRHLNKK